MEFPSLGHHCDNQTCSQLDFLPMKCDACSKVFCKDHITYTSHNCSESYEKDIQVPVCPLCNKPIPVSRGQSPDIVVGQHIDTDCQSDPAKAKRNVYTNKCSLKGCKQKELVPVLCTSCRLNFCLKHRHTTDHDCQGFQGTGRGVSDAGLAAVQRQNKCNALMDSKSGSRHPNQLLSKVHDLMSEDEALAKALQLSINEQGSSNSVPMTQEEADRILAEQLQQSEMSESSGERRTTRTPNASRNCIVT